MDYGHMLSVAFAKILKMEFRKMLYVESSRVYAGLSELMST